MKDKLRLVFMPFMLALIGLIVGYTFLNWLLFIKLGILQPKEEVAMIILPFLFAGGVTWLYLSPKLKVLQLKVDFFHVFIAFLGLLIPTVLAQKYMCVNTGKLTVLTSVGEIRHSEQTKYYDLGTHYIDTGNKHCYATYEIHGKHAERLCMYFYTVMPICEKREEIDMHYQPAVWLGIVYEEEMSSSISQDRMEAAYNAFISRSQSRVERGDFSHFLCFERIGQSSQYYEEFMKALGQSVSNVSEPIILMGMNMPYGERGGDLLQKFFTAFFIVMFVWLLLSIIPKINPKELKRIKEGKPDWVAKLERQEWLEFITPRKDYFVTPVILLLNVAVFFLMVLAGKGFLTFQADDLISWGACYAPMVSEGQWWRLLTATFLHNGVSHLFGNMFFLVYVSLHLEELISRSQYLCVYLFSALAGSVISLLWHTEPFVAVGASGAIFGLYGAYIALLIGGLYPKKYMKSVLKETLFFIGINLLAGILPGVDNAVHIGGLLCGFFLGLIFLSSCKRKARKEIRRKL